MTRLEPSIVRQQVEHLKLLFPELVEDDEAWGLTLESETDLVELLTKVEDARQEASSMAAGIATRIAELGLRQQRYERKEQAMRKLAFNLMIAAKIGKVELDMATLSIRRGGMKLVIPDDAAVPDEYMRIKKEPDRALIKNMMTEHDIQPNWAALAQSEDTLAVRTK